MFYVEMVLMYFEVNDIMLSPSNFLAPVNYLTYLLQVPVIDKFYLLIFKLQFIT